MKIGFRQTVDKGDSMKKNSFVTFFAVLMIVCLATLLVACGGANKKRGQLVADYEEKGYSVEVKDGSFVTEHNKNYADKKADSLAWCFVATKNEVLNEDGKHFTNYVVTVYYFEKFSRAENFGSIKNAEEAPSISGCEYKCNIDWENNLLTVTESYTFAIE